MAERDTRIEALAAAFPRPQEGTNLIETAVLTADLAAARDLDERKDTWQRYQGYPILKKYFKTSIWHGLKRGDEMVLKGATMNETKAVVLTEIDLLIKARSGAGAAGGGGGSNQGRSSSGQNSGGGSRSATSTAANATTPHVLNLMEQQLAALQEVWLRHPSLPPSGPDVPFTPSSAH